MNIKVVKDRNDFDKRYQVKSEKVIDRTNKKGEKVRKNRP